MIAVCCSQSLILKNPKEKEDCLRVKLKTLKLQQDNFRIFLPIESSPQHRGFKYTVDEKI